MTTDVFVFEIINRSLIFAGDWFLKLMTASKMSSAYISFVFIFLTWRFLLSPIFSGAGSDKVKKSKTSKEE